MKTIEQRFWPHVSKPDGEKGCWIWTGAINRGGYGHLRHDKKDVTAHRASWEIHNGKIPDGLNALHKCDVRACVNPDHLRTGTQKENIDDAMTKKRMNLSGLKAGNNKLSIEQVKEVKAAPHYRKLCSDFAKKFGVDRNTILLIRQNKTWKNLTTLNQ